MLPSAPSIAWKRAGFSCSTQCADVEESVLIQVTTIRSVRRAIGVVPYRPGLYSGLMVGPEMNSSAIFLTLVNRLDSLLVNGAPKVTHAGRTQIKRVPALAGEGKAEALQPDHRPGIRPSF